MKAIVVRDFGEPEALKVEAVPDLQPGAGQVLLRVKAAGVNPVDTYIRAGTYTKPPLPYTPGLDGAGTVEAWGAGVTGLSVGDRRYCSGTLTGSYAEFALCAPEQLHPLPAHVTFAQGAAVNVPYATAYRALFYRAHTRAGETLLIHGASGGVGIAAVQLARAAGLTVVGTAGTDKGQKLVREEGAHHVLDHRAQGYLDRVMTLTEGRGVDVILEMLANVNLGKDLTVLAKGGRVVVIGSRGKVEIDPRDAMAQDASIHGMLLFNAPEQDLRSIHAALAAGLDHGTLRPVVGREFMLAEAPLAHRAVMEAGAYGKIVLTP